MNRASVITVIVGVLVVGIGAVVGVYHFRSTRFTPSRLEQERAARQQALQEDESGTVGYGPEYATQRAPDTFRVGFRCTCGDFEVECYRDWAPHAADRFYNLALQSFFNEARFFRVVPGFVVQFGLPSRPEVAMKWANAPLPDDPVKQSNVEGTLAFAAAGPNTRTTQIFINLGNNAETLDPQGFAVFGKVISGMETVRAINSEYGQAPDQNLIRQQGNAYLKRAFPRLDFIHYVNFISEPPAESQSAPDQPPTTKSASPQSDASSQNATIASAESPADGSKSASSEQASSNVAGPPN